MSVILAAVIIGYSRLRWACTTSMHNKYEHTHTVHMRKHYLPKTSRTWRLQFKRKSIEMKLKCSEMTVEFEHVTFKAASGCFGHTMATRDGYKAGEYSNNNILNMLRHASWDTQTSVISQARQCRRHGD